MFCEKCGSEIPESVICPKCGCLSGYKNNTAPSAAMVRKRKYKYESAASAVMIAAVVIMAVQIIVSVMYMQGDVLCQLCNCLSIAAYVCFAVLFLLKKPVYLKALFISMIADLVFAALRFMINFVDSLDFFEPLHISPDFYEPWHIVLWFDCTVLCTIPLVFALIRKKESHEFLGLKNIESHDLIIKIMVITADLLFVINFVWELYTLLRTDNYYIYYLYHNYRVKIILAEIIPLIAYMCFSVLYLLKKQIYLKFLICALIYSLLSSVAVHIYLDSEYSGIDLYNIFMFISPAALCILPVIFILLKQQKAEQKRI